MDVKEEQTMLEQKKLQFCRLCYGYIRNSDKEINRIAWLPNFRNTVFKGVRNDACFIMLF